MVDFDFEALKTGDRVRVVREFVVDDLFKSNGKLYAFDDEQGREINVHDDSIVSIEVLAPALPTEFGSLVTIVTTGGNTQVVLTGGGWVDLAYGHKIPVPMTSYKVISIDRVGV